MAPFHQRCRSRAARDEPAATLLAPAIYTLDVYQYKALMKLII